MTRGLGNPMGRPTTSKPVRSDKEAWDMVVENKGLVVFTVNRFVNNHRNLIWYTGDDLRAEVESWAYEGFFKACRLWEPEKGKLSTYGVKAMENKMSQQLDNLVAMGGSRRGGPQNGKAMPWPLLFSAEALAEKKSEDSEFTATAATELDDEGEGYTWEDDFIDKMMEEKLIAAIYELAHQMPEPHGKVFRTLALPQEGIDRNRTVRDYGPGMPLKKAAKHLGMAAETIKPIYSEGKAWMRHQLAARGLVWEEEDE